MFDLICCAVSKHEGLYLKDFIDWHKALGVDKFVIYDEGSDHETLKVLEPYCWREDVEYIPSTKHPAQYQSYWNCIQRYVGITEWILFLDIDEYINPHGLDDLNLKNFLKKFNHPNIGAVGMAWNCFGTSESNLYEDSPVWERITMRVDYEGKEKHHTRHIKSFIRPQCVATVNDPHFFPMKQGFYTVDPNNRVLHTSEWKSWDFPMDQINISHYVTKTKEEWVKKFERGSADSGPDAHNARKLEDFERHISACTREDKTIWKVAQKIGLM